MDSYWTNKKIFVTGADGFIGSHLTETLVRKGAEVRALAFYNSLGSLGWLDKLLVKPDRDFEVLLGDIRDYGQMQSAVCGVDGVFHLASLIGIPYSYMAPRSYIDTNVFGCLNILQACQSAGVSNVVVTSTSEVYGSAQYLPMDEMHPLSAQSPYAASKIGADQLALSFQRSFDLPVKIIRPFNTYGPRQSARAIIPTVITQLLNGSKVRVGNLSSQRDFTYVSDTVAGLMAGMVSDAAVGQVINLGVGTNFSIGATIDLIAEIMGVEVEVEQEIERIRPDKSEVDNLLSDNSQAKNILSWRPEYDDAGGFRRGLELTVGWLSDSSILEIYRPNSYAY